MKNIPLMSSIILFLLGITIIAIEYFKEIPNSAWVRHEMYISILLNVLFFALLSNSLYLYLKSKDRVLKYIMSAAIMIAVAFIFVLSLQDQETRHDFPALVGMNLISIAYILPGLLLIRGAVALIGKMTNKSNL